MEELNKRPRDLSALEVAFNQHCKYTNQSKKEVAKSFGMSYVTLYRKLHSNTKLETSFVKKLSEFLNTTEEYVVNLHNNIEKETPPQVRIIKQRPYLSLIVVLIITLSASVFFALGINRNVPDNKPVYTANYMGTGLDINLSTPIVLNDFHSALYRYKFVDVKATISGESISLTCNILITELSNPENNFWGKLNASGVIVSGKAGLSYKITNDINQETWVGVFMLDFPLSGDVIGYWLTSHNDSDPKSTGSFAMGDIQLSRKHGEMPTQK